jgi:transcriptional regulator GlxA family with amidase domain
MMSHLQHKRAVNKKGFLTLRPEEISTVRQMTKRMANELQNRISGYKSVCVLTLADLIIFLSRKAARHNIASHSETLAETLCYMEKNYTENISLEKLSRIAGLSPRNFQRLFKNYMGLSPFNHLINIRLQHAKKLLEESALNISEIADATGFGDSAYFARQFKKTFRISPTEHRKQTRLADN